MSKSISHNGSLQLTRHRERTFEIFSQDGLSDRGADGKGGNLLSKELIDKVNEVPSWGDVTSSPERSHEILQDSPRGSTMDLTCSTVDALRSSLEGLVRSAGGTADKSFEQGRWKATGLPPLS